MNSDGLIFARILDGSGGGRNIDWEDLEQWTPESGLLWVHLDYSVKEAQQWLDEKSGLSPLTCEMLVEEDTRPRVLTSRDGLFLILRGVNFNPGADPEDMVALRMNYSENRIITMRQRRVMALDDVNRAIESGDGPTRSGEFMSMAVERIVDRMGVIIAEVDEGVDDLEDTVLSAESYELRPKISRLRRQSISLRRYIAPQRDVLTRLSNENISWLTDKDKLRLRECAERTARFVEDIDSARDRAAIIQEELNNRLSEQINKAMYLLSIVAAIFLPLGLLTGLLGINVGGIPGSENHWAFAIVCMILLVIAVLLLSIFKRIKWL